jgi:hypothetical protein
MVQRQFNTPEKSETREIFTPTRWQVLGSVYFVRPPHPRRRLSRKKGFLILIVVSAITYLITYAIVRALG